MTDFPFTEARAAWIAAFVKAQHSLINPPKTKIVSTGKFSYTYAALPDIIDSVRGVLAEQGLAVAQSVEAGAGGYVGVTTTIYHSAGHSETFGPLLLPAGSSPQEAGSAISYARRYSLCAALNIAADEDDDGAKVPPKAPKKASVSPEVQQSTPGEQPGAKVEGEAAKAPGGSTSAGEARGESAGSVTTPAEYPPKPAAGTSDTPPSQDGPEVPARGACLHLLGSETVKRSGGDSVEVCKKCRRVLGDVRA